MMGRYYFRACTNLRAFTGTTKRWYGMGGILEVDNVRYHRLIMGNCGPPLHFVAA